jgi:hypothetical protein
MSKLITGGGYGTKYKFLILTEFTKDHWFVHGFDEDDFNIIIKDLCMNADKEVNESVLQDMQLASFYFNCIAYGFKTLEETETWLMNQELYCACEVCDIDNTGHSIYENEGGNYYALTF